MNKPMNKFEQQARLMAPHITEETPIGALLLAYTALGYNRLPVTKLQGASGIYPVTDMKIGKGMKI